MVRFKRLVLISLGTALVVLCAATQLIRAAITPDDPGAAAIRFTINSGQSVKPISPYIYGMNFFSGSTLTNPVTLDRLGGNRWSAYNWETNASNAGKDYRYQNDNYLVGNRSNTAPGTAVLEPLQSAAAKNRALVVTVPTAGWASADANGQPVTLDQVAKLGRFRQVVPKKSTIYPGSPLSTTPDKTDNYVFTDEFVNLVEASKAPGQNVFYSLDNEPALWGEPLPANWSPLNWQQPNQPGRTHPEIHPAAPTFAELRDKTIAHAGAIKDVNPNAIVFGGVSYGYAEFTSLQGAPDATSTPSHPGGNQPGELNYLEWLLQQVHTAEIAQGRKLMDVLDVHWYPEAQGGGVRVTEQNNSAAVVAARVQSPRSLWDPTYTETSWITGCCSGGPIKLLKHLQRDVDDFSPGTKLAITEYNYGGTNHISGAIAEADVLGIFGREGLFAANFWSLYGDSQSQFASAAFKMFLNYDNAGGEFGDTSVNADTSGIANSAVYASLDSTDPNRMVVVAINRTGSPQTTGIAVTHDRVFDHAEVYQLTANASGAPLVTHTADIGLDLINAFQYSMPAWSVSTLVLVSDGLPGDFNHDHTVDATDYVVWRDAFGQTGNLAADGNEDNIVDADDYALWRAYFGRSESAIGAATQAAVPEPATLTVVIAACLALCVFRQHRTTLGI